MKKTALAFVFVTAILAAPATFSQEPAGIFRVPVNYDLNVAEAVREGKYDWVNSDINDKHFPINPARKRNLSCGDRGLLFLQSLILQSLDSYQIFIQHLSTWTNVE